ncbi:hypothetical protein GTP44_03905 [Duganella sp. FT50W]|uniref:Uncharacterized protein n=1 Tax=Duganella lactea TaxID=2692173 RepID=A0A6L8MGX2_9BURK|nr:hypothetical protein [Duganella lactea]MYM81102.1 hypothetical protein [Duganella lactea]
MANTKKPRKAYRPKPALLPLGMRRQVQMEMPGYQAMIALGMDHLQEQHIYDLLSAADLAKRTAPAGHPIRELAQSMVLACADIQHRAERVGKTGANGNEMRTLKAGLPQVMDFLRTVPNADIARAASAAVAEFDRSGVLRV